MSNVALPSRRGLTLLEFVLALAITAMVGAAVSAMLASVASGQRLRRDNHAYVIRTHVATSRLAAYVGPARCFLEAGGGDLVVWINDSRESGTVHATEIRWLIFNPLEGTIDVHYVDLPDEWTEVTMGLEDLEYPLGTDWSSVLSSYQTKGLVSKLTLLDGLATVNVSIDQAAALDSRQVIYDLEFQTEGEALPQTISATIFIHRPPTS